MSIEDRKYDILMDRRAGHSIKDLSAKYHFSRSYINKLCTNNGVYKVRRIDSEAVILDHAKGMRLLDIATKYGVWPQSITRILRKEASRVNNK